MSGFHLGFSRWYISLAASVWSDGLRSFGYPLPIWWRRSLRLHANSCAYHLCSFSQSNSCRYFRVWSDGSRSLSCAPCAYKNAIPPELILLESLDCDLFSFARPRPSSYQVDYPSSLRLDIALSSSSFFCHRRLPSMTTLTFCIPAISIFPTISPFGIDGNIVFHFSPFDIKGKGLSCLLRLPLTLCTQL